MRRIINYSPSTAGKIVLGALPFVATLVAYIIASDARLAIDPNDKIMPGFASFLSAMQRLLTQVDPSAGMPLFWYDTWLTLFRLFIGLGFSALIGLVFGVLIGFIPHIRGTLWPMLAALSLVPPLAILPILFIAFGLGELSKAVLVIFSITPFITRDIVLKVESIPREQIVKAQTLGASTWQMMVDIVLPQALLRLVETIRLVNGAAWVFVIAAEAITAEGGLGYRIFLVRRYLAMDVILPYVVWITLLAYLMDLGLRGVLKLAFPWHGLKAD